MINIIGSSRYRVDKQRLTDFMHSLYTQKNITEDQTVNIIFVGKRKMRDIASKYKHEDEALPVLAFPYQSKEQEERLLGEIFLCYPQLVLMAAHRNKTVADIIFQMVEHGLKNILNHK